MLKVVNAPVRVKMTDYQDEIARYVELVSPLPGVVAVGTVGSVGTVGYSDVDYVLIVDGSFDPRNADLLFQRHPDRDRRIVLHAPLIVSAELYREFATHLFFDEPVAYFGSFDRLPHNHNPAARTASLRANLIDFCETRIVQQAAAKFSGTIDQRHAMTAMWSSTHSETIADLLDIPLSSAARHTTAALRAERAAWRSGEAPRNPDFLELYEANCEFTEELLVAALRSESEAFGEELTASQSEVRFVGGTKSVVCSASTTEVSATSRTLTVKGRTLPLSTIVAAPMSMASHLLAYGFAPENSEALSVPTSPIAVVLQRRASFARRYYSFLAPLGLARANGPYVVLPVISPSRFAKQVACHAHSVIDRFSRMRA